MTEPAQVPPHAVESEKALIGHLIDHPESFEHIDGLEPGHFYDRTSVLLARALWSLHRAGKSIDAATVAGALRESKAWTDETQGALVSLLSVSAIPPSHVPQHAEAIRQKARDRALLSSCRSAAALIQSGSDPREALDQLRQQLDAHAKPAKRELIRDLPNVELCEAIMGAGPRIPLGIQPLDDKLHGGMRLRKLFGVGGAPGAWKTSFLVQIADYLCQQQGIAVAWLAYDECAEEIMSRRLQARGVPRCRAEDPDEETLIVARELDQLPFHVFEHKPFDEVIETFAAMYPNADRFVFIDSAQKMWTRESRTLTTLRERIDLCLETARRLAEARATQCAVFFTSEVGRELYRNRNNTEINDLAAGKESGGIEYGMDVWSVLRCVPGDPETITMSMPKCRIGTKLLQDESFEFIPDREHVHLRVLGSDAREELHKQAAADQLAKARAKMLKALRDNPRGLSPDDWREESKVKKQTFNRVARRLEDEELVDKVTEGRSHRVTWRLRV